MTWNYRVVKRHTKNPQSLGGNEFYTYSIHEAYYNDDGEVWGITENPVDMSAEHLNELMIQWDMLIEAFNMPLLDYEDVVNNGADPGFSMADTDEEREELKTRPLEDVFEDLGLEPFDSGVYAREEAELSKKEELQYTEGCVGRSPEHIHSLIKILRSQSP